MGIEWNMIKNSGIQKLFDNQTWLAGKSRSKRMFLVGKIPNGESSIAMFDYQRVIHH